MLEFQFLRSRWGTFLLILKPKQDMISIGSLMERYRCCYEHTERIHIDRTSGGYCNHCAVDGDIDACIAAGEKTVQGSCMQE